MPRKQRLSRVFFSDRGDQALSKRIEGKGRDKGSDGEPTCDGFSKSRTQCGVDININILPPELLLQIFSYLNPVDLFSLKLAGSRYVTENIRSLPRLSFSIYVEKTLMNDDPRPALLIAAAVGHETLLRALLERAIHSDLSQKRSTRSFPPWRVSGHRGRMQEREKFELCKQKYKYIDGMSAIHQAAESGQNLIVIFLLSKGIGVGYLDNSGRTPLHYAARTGHNTTIKLLLENGATASVQDLNGYTAVHEAAQNGHEQSVKLLLNNGAEADPPSRSFHNKNAVTPLHLAARNGHRAVVELLLDNNASINQRGGEVGGTPFYYAAAVGNGEVVRLLLDRGADTKADSPSTPIASAAANGCDTVVKLLLNQDNSEKEIALAISYAMENGHATTLHLLLLNTPHAEWKDGPDQRTFLHHAVCRGLTSMILILLEHEADLEARDNQGNTPLLCALKYSAEDAKKEIVHLLLGKGADIEARDNQEITPLLYAARYGYTETAGLLLGKGANYEAKDDQGSSPLICAAKLGYIETVTLLLDNGANIDAKDNQERTPLIWATRLEYENIVGLLVRKGANIEARDNDGDTPLLCAVAHAATCEQICGLRNGLRRGVRCVMTRRAPCGVPCAKPWGKMEIVNLLLDKGANIEARDNRGNTPLIWAVRLAYEDIVNLLLDKGADIEARDNRGNTSLIWAVRLAYEHIVNLLLDNGANIIAKNYDNEMAFEGRRTVRTEFQFD